MCLFYCALNKYHVQHGTTLFLRIQIVYIFATYTHYKASPSQFSETKSSVSFSWSGRLVPEWCCVSFGCATFCWGGGSLCRLDKKLQSVRTVCFALILQLEIANNSWYSNFIDSFTLIQQRQLYKLVWLHLITLRRLKLFTFLRLQTLWQKWIYRGSASPKPSTTS